MKSSAAVHGSLTPSAIPAGRTFLVIACSLGSWLIAPAAPVSFRTDVMAVLGKAGCNAGTCHGNANGKGGFKLSLRGEDPQADFRTLTRELFARRLNALEPDQSLILLKATTQLAHEGGQRFARHAPEYEVLRQWIQQGARDDAEAAPRLIRLEVTPRQEILLQPRWQTQIRAQAIFSTGQERDVTSWAVYESSHPQIQVDASGRVSSERPGETTINVRYLGEQLPVRLTFVPERPGFDWTHPPARNYVDEWVHAKLRTVRMNPSELSSDSEFVRRAYLDLLCLLPTAEEARAFVQDSRPDKRDGLIETLLQRPEFADFWALKWSDLLRNEEKALDRKGVQAFHHWIRQSLAANKPLDQFVRDIIAARGSTYQNPAANYYRSLRDPIARAEATAQVFLGTRLQCAKCHSHPFDRWTQADYYDWATLFAQVQYRVLENHRRDKLDTHEFVGEQIVWMARDGAVTNPKTGRNASSRFLDMSDMAPSPAESVGRDWNQNRPAPGQDPLLALAEWIASPDNPLFARVQVNRAWTHLMGRGIVEPIDDFRPTNPPSNPELLDALTRHFVASGFDLRELIRTLMRSHTYQRTAHPNDTNRDDDHPFARAVVRRLTAEQLLNAFSQVTGSTPTFNGYPAGMRATQIPGSQTFGKRGRSAAPADTFLKVFGKPERLLTCECERSDETTMSQAFQLITGPTLHDMLTDPDNRLGQWLKDRWPPRRMIEELYWLALSRPPTAREWEAMTHHLDRAQSQRPALEDLTWAVLNSKEFVLRH